jgi:hypothetical protein
MKSAPDLGLNITKYKGILTDDAKYRYSRVIYMFLFQLSELNIQVPSMVYKAIFIVFIEEIIIIIKHMVYLLSSYKGI